MRRKRGTGTIERVMAGGELVYRPRLPNAARTPLGTYATEREATAALEAALELAAQGRVTDAAKLLDYGERVIDRREKEGYRNTADERRRWRSYVGPWECASWHLADVRRRHVAEWARGLVAQQLAHQTVTNAVNLLRAVYRAAVDDELVEANPVEGFRVKKTGRTDETSTWLTLDELSRLFWSVDEDVRPLVVFAATTGLRQGEMLALRMTDVHLRGEQPHVVVRFGAPGQPTKSGKIRRVPLMPLAESALKAWLRIRKTPPLGSSDIVFTSATGLARAKGHPVGSHARWRSWLDAAGIRRHVRWHDLRHTCATLLLTGAFGEPWSMEAVKEMLGHSSITVTERYAKATGSLAEAAARVSHAQATKPLRGTDEVSTKSAELLEIWSRLRDLNSRPTVYEVVARLSVFEVLELVRAVSVALLRRAAQAGDLPRGVVDGAATMLDASEQAGEVGQRKVVQG
ncbi:MAG: site-specific integrase [Caulobacteraceae bacterium]|nr:site-specific integrase [Caulobacteraceae bacterium]